MSIEVYFERSSDRHGCRVIRTKPLSIASAIVVTNKAVERCQDCPFTDDCSPKTNISKPNLEILAESQKDVTVGFMGNVTGESWCLLINNPVLVIEGDLAKVDSNHPEGALNIPQDFIYPSTHFF